MLDYTSRYTSTDTSLTAGRLRLSFSDHGHRVGTARYLRYVTVRDITGTWHLTLRRDPNARHEIPTSYEVLLTQQGNQLSGRITPSSTNKPTVVTGSVEHPTRVQFGSEHAWWNDDEDAYFDLYVSDGALMIQMMNFKPNRCGPQIPCLGALMNKQ